MLDRAAFLRALLLLFFTTDIAHSQVDGGKVVSKDVRSVFAFSPDGKYLAWPTQSKDVVQVYDLKADKVLREHKWTLDAKSPFRTVGRMSFTNDSRTLVYADEDHGVFHVADVQSGKLRDISRGDLRKDDNRIWTYTRDSKSIVAADGKGDIAVFDLKTGAQTKLIIDEQLPLGTPFGIAVSPDSKVVAMTTGGRGWIFDLDSGMFKCKLTDESTRMHSTKGAVTFSPDGKLLALAHDRFGTNALQRFSDDMSTSIEVWNFETKTRIHTLSEPAVRPNYGGKYCVAFLPDGKTLIGTAGDFQVKFWEAETGKEIAASGIKSVEDFQLSADGKSIAVYVRKVGLAVYSVKSLMVPKK